MFHFIFPKLNIKIERWKWNKEYQVYVSTFGNVKDKNKNPIHVKISEKGYMRVRTKIGYPLLHRLVLMTWRPIDDVTNMTVDHLNHNKRDNSIYNLEWVTLEENLKREKEDFISNAKIQEIPIENKKNFISDINTQEKIIDDRVEEAYAWAIKHKIFNVQQLKQGSVKLKYKINKAILEDKSYSGVNWRKLTYHGKDYKIIASIKGADIFYPETQEFNNIEEAYDWGMEHAFGLDYTPRTDLLKNTIQERIKKSAITQIPYCGLIWKVAAV